MVILPDVRLKSAVGALVVVVIVAVSVTGLVLQGGAVSPTPNPQRGGSSTCAGFRLVPHLRPARLG